MRCTGNTLVADVPDTKILQRDESIRRREMKETGVTYRIACDMLKRKNSVTLEIHSPYRVTLEGKKSFGIDDDGKARSKLR
jgi:hypothetical protein